jgi:uncharacterized protein (DUF1778 family)
MNIASAIAKVEAAVTRQLDLAGSDAAVEAAGHALMAALDPALRQFAGDLAEEAAAEVSAQLTDHRVEVVVSEGEPTLTVRTDESGTSYAPEDMVARLTLRLPEGLKALIEDSAGDVGESVNAYVVKELSRKSGRSKKAGRRITGTIET